MDYRDVGRLLQDAWLRRGSELSHAFRAALAKFNPSSSGYDFIHALFDHARGNSKLLIDYLRSDQPLTPMHREYFAQVLEGVLDRPPRRGRPRNEDVRRAAMQARVFHQNWRKENKQRGISDHGCGNAMREEAVRFVIEVLDPELAHLDVGVVLQMLDRPTSRRNS